MMSTDKYTRTSNDVGLVNTDITAYRDALAKKKRAKYINGLEQRIDKLESAMDLLQKTVKEITK
mgnify:CR=1 FL=1|tara:strand:- start:970 stop:1161 length:192 start_codon:yes stop_codon:yes gene_type:complete